MTKPLELTVNRPFQDRQGNDWYVWGDTCVSPSIADSYSKMKRFTESELAAEYWRSREDKTLIIEGITWESMADDWSISEADALDREYVLDAFATLPHAADKDYQ